MPECPEQGRAGLGLAEASEFQRSSSERSLARAPRVPEALASTRTHMIKAAQWET